MYGPAHRWQVGRCSEHDSFSAEREELPGREHRGQRRHPRDLPRLLQLRGQRGRRAQAAGPHAVHLRAAAVCVLRAGPDFQTSFHI